MILRCHVDGREWVPTAATHLEPYMRLTAVIAPEADGARRCSGMAAPQREMTPARINWRPAYLNLEAACDFGIAGVVRDFTSWSRVMYRDDSPTLGKGNVMPKLFIFMLTVLIGFR